MKKRLLSMVLAVMMILSLLPTTALAAIPLDGSSDALSAPNDEIVLLDAVSAADAEYTIYPLPREITYGNDAIAIPNRVNVVWGESIDIYTKQHLQDALDQLPDGVILSESDSAQSGAFNILVGVRGDGSAADTALRSVNSTMTISSAGQTYSEDIFTGEHAFDGYIIRVDASGIALVGKDTDAAYYAITTLKHIFAEMTAKDLSGIRYFTLRDYASVAYRGFIEGYYGIPWTHENRISLMEWGSEWKMDMYVFAPKDDEYHNSKWRELYPASELPKIAELAETGLRTKNRYVYALHPFQNRPFNFNDFENDVQLIIAKFDQLYEIGVRQFAILADDAGTYTGEQFSQLLNRLNQWRKTKEGVYPLVFCPDKYNASWCNSSDYVKMAKLNDLLDDDVAIFWTGLGVCGHATADDANAFLNNINNATAGDKDCRRPLMWINWPCDDINMSRLVLGPGSNEGGAQGYSRSVDVLKQGDADYFAGIISNPMQQAQLNRIPLFAIADFAWNDDDYNGQQSWADCFQFVDPDAADALHTLAKHMSDPSPNSHSMICGESEELKEKLDDFLTAYQNGEEIAGLAPSLISEFQMIVMACDDLYLLSRNEGLKEEIDSFRLSLRDLAESAIAFINTAVVLETGKTTDVWSYYSEGTAKLASSRTYTVNLLNGGTQIVSPGSKRLIPFVTSLSNALSDPVQRVINPDYEIPVIEGIYISDDLTRYGGTPAEAADYDETTYYWVRSKAEMYGPLPEGAYVGMGFATPTTITRFRILGGKDGNANDYFHNAILEYRVKGEDEFKPVPDGNGGIFTTKDKEWDFTSSPLTNVVDIRARLLEQQTPWICMREFGPYDPDNEPISGAAETYTVTGFKSDNLSRDYGYAIGNMVDGNDSTYAYFYAGDGNYVGADDYVGVDLGSVKPIGLITILQGKNATDSDKMSNAILEYSTDGVNYTVLQSGINDNDFSYDCSDSNISARYIRLRNPARVNVWAAIREFTVEAPYSPVFRSENMVYGSNNAAAYGPDRKVIDDNDTTYAHYGSGSNGNGNIPAGAFIGLRLDKKTLLGRIRILQGTSDSNADILENAILEYSDDGGNTYHTILDNINQNVIDIDLSSSGIKATHVRLRNGRDSSHWLALRTFSVEEATDANAYVDTNAAGYQDCRSIITDDTGSIGMLLGQVTLQPGEYLGIKLPRIREVNGITVTGGIPAGLTLTAGCNELELAAIADPAAITGSNTVNARYIRLENNGSSAVTFSFNGLTVTSKEIQAPSIVSSSFPAPYGNCTASALFDGNLGTEYVWGGAQRANQSAVIDIGQVVHIDSIQLIVNDSNNDWIRYADLEGSLSPNGPWTALTTIGDPTAGDTTALLDGNSGWTHTISYCWSGSKEGDAPLNVDARYLRLTLKQNPDSVHYWTRIREIGINNLLVGNDYTPPYMATINDPTFVAPRETSGYPAQSLADGSVATTYLPEPGAASGSILYRLSEDVEGIRQISVLQSPGTISNATVSVRAANSGTFVPLGTLAYSRNEFLVPNTLSSVAEIKIEWNGIIPEIHEIFTVRKAPDPVDKTELEAAIEAATGLTDKPEHAQVLTDMPELLAAFTAAWTAAQTAMASETMLQASIDQAASDLRAAVDAIENPVYPGVEEVTLGDNGHSLTLYTNPRVGTAQVNVYILTATILPELARDKTVTWTSNNPDVATVEATSQGAATATVTARQAGTATITVTTNDGEKTATCRVTVRTNPEVIHIWDGSDEVAEGGILTLYTNQTADLPSGGRNSVTLTATLEPSTSIADLTWDCTDDAAGLISVVGDSVDTAKCTITVTGISETNVGEKTVEARTADDAVAATFKVRVLRHLVHDVTISVAQDQTPRPGVVVEANINQLGLDDAGNNGLTYQWYRGGDPIDGATDKTYTLADADIGAVISVKVKAEPTDTYFYEGERTSTNTVTVGRNAAPAAPVLSATDADNGTKGSITITGFVDGTAYEISSDGGNTWKDATVGAGGVIGELDAGDYQVRLKATDTHDAGLPGTITVKDASKTYHEATCTITADPADSAAGVATLNKTSVEDGTSVTLTVKPSAAYEITAVTANGTELTGTAGADGAMVYTVDGVNDDVAFSVSLTKRQVKIIHALTNLTCDLPHGEGGDHTVAYGEVETITLTAGTGFDLPASVRITRKNGTEFTAYTYSQNSGTITITGGVTEDITITAVGTVKRYQVAYTGMTGVTGPEAAACIATHGQNYTAKLTAQTGYRLPETITVKRGAETLTVGTDYTYNSETGNVTIFAAAVTGNLSISATGEYSLIALVSVTISGYAQVGQELVAKVVPEDAAYEVNYQWLWIAADGSETVIGGATEMTRTLTEASLGKRIAVRVTPDNDSGYMGTVTSAPTARIIAAGAPIVHVGEVSLNRNSAALKVGETTRLIATISPANATNQAVTWRSSSESVATVNGVGIVTAVGEGTAVITVTTVDGNQTATCTVTVTRDTSIDPGDETGGNLPTLPPLSNTTTTTTTNPDGTTTTTVTDNVTGTVTATTEKNDGSVEVVETKKDGTVTTTVTDPDGGKVEKVTTPDEDVTITVTDKDGEELAKVEIPAEIPALDDDKTFIDVREGYFAEEAINNMAALGVVNGKGDRIFDPKSPMKRSELAKVLYELANGKEGFTTDFVDVPSTKWYADSVAWAVKAGVVKGVSDTEFEPERTITREELAAMLCRYARMLGMDTTAQTSELDVFNDGATTHAWAASDMAWCVQNGILQGKGNGVLDPRSEATRAEVAVMLQRFVNLIAK